jgi:hypothetical protein
MFIIGRTYKVMTGEEMSVDAYLMNVLRFYWDWAAGLSGIASYGVKWVIVKVAMPFAQLLVWLDRRTTMVVGAMQDTNLQYENPNTVQF